MKWNKPNHSMPYINFLVILIILFFSLRLFAADDNPCVGARSSGMGHSSVALSDFWAVQNNQAGLSDFKNIALGFYYNNPFFLKELSLKTAAFVLPTKSGVFGVNLNYFGYKLYNESKLGLAYAKSFGKMFSTGIQLDYVSTHIGENYGSKNVLTFEVGIRSQLNKNLCIAAHIFNPIRAKIADYNDERVETIIKLGVLYSFSDKLLVTVETDKYIDYKPVLKAGVEYSILKKTYLRMGISTNPSIYTFGFGLNFKRLKIDFATTIHQVLGSSPQISLVYDIK